MLSWCSRLECVLLEEAEEEEEEEFIRIHGYCRGSTFDDVWCSKLECVLVEHIRCCLGVRNWIMS